MTYCLPSDVSLTFQSPLPRGSHCNLGSQVQERHYGDDPFSPLYLGVLTATCKRYQRPSRPVTFQSPLPRGSHCNGDVCSGGYVFVFFQSPLPRGSHCNLWNSARNRVHSCLSVPSTSGFSLQLPPRANRETRRKLLSVPSTSGFSLQPYRRRAAVIALATFSPLYLGVLTATVCNRNFSLYSGWLSVPSTSGFSLQPNRSGVPRSGLPLSVPSTSGFSLQPMGLRFVLDLCPPFSPLYLGVLTATSNIETYSGEPRGFQSPLPRGSHCNSCAWLISLLSFCLSVPSTSGFSLQQRSLRAIRSTRVLFQSPLPRGSHCNVRFCGRLRALIRLSVPSTSGFSLQRRLSSPKSGTGSLSVPSTSGFSLQRNTLTVSGLPNVTFSPLYLGVLTATTPCAVRDFGTRSFSPLYLGVLTATQYDDPVMGKVFRFQSPLPRGSHCNLVKMVTLG